MIGVASAESFPYGEVIDGDGTTFAEGATVTAFDIDNNSNLGSNVTGSDGRYEIDLGT